MHVCVERNVEGGVLGSGTEDFEGKMAPLLDGRLSHLAEATTCATLLCHREEQMASSHWRDFRRGDHVRGDLSNPAHARTELTPIYLFLGDCRSGLSTFKAGAGVWSGSKSGDKHHAVPPRPWSGQASERVSLSPRCIRTDRPAPSSGSQHLIFDMTQCRLERRGRLQLKLGAFISDVVRWWVHDFFPHHGWREHGPGSR